MVATIPFNPFATTSARGSFNVDSTGWTQGMAEDNPSIRNVLAGGYLASTETLPMWGGVGITEAVAGVSSTVPSIALGGPIGRATTLVSAAANSLTGFSIFDQNYAAVMSAQNPVPLTGSYGSVHFYRLGSGARIPVAIDPSLITLSGSVITSQVSWDFNAQRLQPYLASGGTEAVTSLTWSSTNGGQVAVVMTAASLVGAVGDVITVSGATNTGTGGNSIVNGTFTVNTFTSSTNFTFLLPAAAGVVGTIGGTILLNYGVGALNVRIEKIQVGNCMTVNYNQLTGTATWNYSDSAALIII